MCTIMERALGNRKHGQLSVSCEQTSLRTQPTFGDASTGFPAKWRLRNERRNSMLMTPYLGSDASSVWNFCARFSDVIWRGNQWQRHGAVVYVGSSLTVHNHIFSVHKLWLNKLMQCLYWSVSSKWKECYWTLCTDRSKKANKNLRVSQPFHFN